MSFEEDAKAIQKALGSPKDINIQMFIQLLISGQPCDITFRGRKPLIDVVLDSELKYALMYGAGVEKLQQMMTTVRIKGGGSFNYADVWTILPMPASGFTEEELASVDLAQAEEPSGPGGVTMRKMISDTYHCESREEEDHFLRRFYAS